MALGVCRSSHGSRVESRDGFGGGVVVPFAAAESRSDLCWSCDVVSPFAPPPELHLAHTHQTRLWLVWDCFHDMLATGLTMISHGFRPLIWFRGCRLGLWVGWQLAQEPLGSHSSNPGSTRPAYQGRLVIAC